MIQLFWDKSTIVLKGLDDADGLPGVRYDKRVRMHRAPAWRYREVVLALRERKLEYQDDARAFEPVALPLSAELTPRSYQTEAMNAWWRSRRGVIVLPTGAGKTILAVMLIAKIGRPALIHVPTIDLMHQWRAVLRRFIDVPVGAWGGGENDTQVITVTTYDSGLIHLDSKGDRFGMIVFDECHRLPGEQYQHLAIGNIAPFRLGLSATPERPDGRESLLYEWVGPIRYQADIHALTGNTLAPFEVFTIEVEMGAAEREAYEEAYAEYVGFLRGNNIALGGQRGWRNFIYQASRTPAGRSAFKAYLRQKKLSQASAAKDEKVWRILQQHRGDRIIIFTQDNDMAYRLGRRFLLPVITHKTKLKEREAFLDRFRSGEYGVMVTSKVLNEGVDVPEANVAIVVSGSGSVREHVQRLGRILRAKPGKTAVLYELIAAETREFYVNERRKQHHAYQGSG